MKEIIDEVVERKRCWYDHREERRNHSKKMVSEGWREVSNSYELIYCVFERVIQQNVRIREVKEIEGDDLI